MIAHLKGTLADKGVDRVVVDVGGVGFQVIVSLHTLAELPAAGESVALRTELLVREDALTLYGFGSDEERLAFSLLTSVQGIGPKLAMACLSALAPSDLARAIRSGDHARLTRVPGIGKKTAERLVLELRDKLDAVPLTKGVARAPADAARSTPAAQVTSALVNLGYRLEDAERAADRALEAASDAPMTEMVKRALRALAEP